MSSLVMYQWISFAVCIFSLACSFLLASIHESVIENNEHNEVKEKSKELKRRDDHQEDDHLVDEKDATMSQLLTRPIILYMIINGLGYASIHAFYPNMSKFFQTRFGFSNV